MKERHSYIGILNGVNGVWCDQKPEGIVVEKEITFYTPDEGMVFTKDNEFFDNVIIEDGVKIEDYTEVKDERPAEEPEHIADSSKMIEEPEQTIA